MAHDSFVETDYAAYYHYYEYDDVYGHFKLYIIIFAKLLKMVVMAKINRDSAVDEIPVNIIYD